ncbi:hypothetical protein, partial [Flammeovirga aprica]
ERVYNFEVEGYHSYYADGIYVHNDYELPPSIAKKLKSLRIDGELKEAFEKSYSKNEAFRNAITGKEDLIKGWIVGIRTGVDDFYSHDPKTLASIVDYLSKQKLSVDQLVKRIPENVDFRLNWFKNVGKFGKVIGKKGDYVVEEAGEVFYRAIPNDHFDELIKGKKLLKPAEWKAKGLTRIGGEGSTSPKLGFSEDYNGVLVKYYLKKGTIDKFVTMGVSNKKPPLIKKYFGEMISSEEYKSITGKKWTLEKVQFKVESNDLNPPQVNIQFGKGKGVDVFNESLITIEIISRKND